MNNVIYVTGNIIGESGHYVARNWVALADDSYKSRAIKVIEGDLVLTSEYDTIPYCEYAAQGGVCCLSNNIGCSEIPDFIYGKYLKEIDKLKRLSDLDIPEDLLQAHLKCLYAGLFAEFEYFIIELLSALIFADESSYKKYIHRKGKKLDRINRMDSVYKSVHKILGHDLERLVEEYSALGITLPDISEIENDILEIRHNVIHRSGKKVNVDHMECLPFTKDGLGILIEHFNAFVTTLMDEVNRIYIKQIKT